MKKDTRHVAVRRSEAARPARCIWGRAFELSLIGALVTAGGVVSAQAQDPNQPAWEKLRLTVRPREMALATESPAAGEYPLDSLLNATVTVPPQCAGARRCPLLVQLPSCAISGRNIARYMTDWLIPMASKHGIIVLVTSRDYQLVDPVLKEVLRRFAVEPAKIAIAGRCLSGPAAAGFAAMNPDVFSRVVLVSAWAESVNNSTGSGGKTVEYLIDQGLHEGGDLFDRAQRLRYAGHPVKLVVALRGYEQQVDDYDFIGHWLQESWAKPDPATRPAPAVVADPLPRLTPQAVRRLTTFWTAFLREPDSIRVTARRAHLREVAVPVGAERPSVWMTDMAALAAKYPSVAADLKHAGLTAQQHDAYRVALISASVTRSMVARQRKRLRQVEPDLRRANNVVFLHAHNDELEVLAKAGITRPSEAKFVENTGMGASGPGQLENSGPLGIWRTP